jgi:hypothetical protein
MMLKRLLFCPVLLMSVWSKPSTTLAGSASPMAKEFTSDIVWRKDLAYVIIMKFSEVRFLATRP